MDISKFKEVEDKYRELKIQLDGGGLTSDELKAKLKKMMVNDDEGNYWMIGGKTGKWYLYNGTDWREGNPYQNVEHIEETSSTQMYSHEESQTVQLESNAMDSPPAARSDVSTQIDPSNTVDCKVCKSKIPVHSVYCTFCGVNQKEINRQAHQSHRKREEDLMIKSIKKSSFLFFFGGLGLIIGVIFGAIFGIFPNLFGDLVYQFPLMFQEAKGGFAGGLLFAAIGGITGFVFFALLSLIMAVVYDMISTIFGGIVFKTKV